MRYMETVLKLRCAKHNWYTNFNKASIVKNEEGKLWCAKMQLNLWHENKMLRTPALRTEGRSTEEVIII